jgi:hypothetical protein
MPPIVLRIVSALGFPSDRNKGLQVTGAEQPTFRASPHVPLCLHTFRAGTEPNVGWRWFAVCSGTSAPACVLLLSESEFYLLFFGSLSSPLAALILLNVHVVIPSFFSVRYQQPSPPPSLMLHSPRFPAHSLALHIAEGERILGKMLDRYPEGALFWWMAGRLLRMKRDPKAAAAAFERVTHLHLTSRHLTCPLTPFDLFLCDVRLCAVGTRSEGMGATAAPVCIRTRYAKCSSS